MARPFESWKRRAPSDRDEARAAELIGKLGDAESLSPQALHRVAHHLRSPERRRLSIFSDVRLAAASVAVLLLFVVSAWATVGYFDRQTQTQSMLAAPRRPVQQTLALNDVPPQAPALAPAAPDETASAEPRLEEPQLRLRGRSERHALLAKDLAGDDESAPGFAQPPPGWASARGAGPADVLAAKKSEAAGRPATDSRSEALAFNDRRAAPAEAPSAPAAAARPSPEPSAQTATMDAAAAPAEAVTAGMSVEGCKATLPIDSQTLASNSGNVERALFRHGVCLLLTGRRDPGLADLRGYLARFPSGRFAEGVRALLVKNPTQAPSR